MASFPIVEISTKEWDKSRGEFVERSVSLLGPFLALESWRPAIAQAKGGGTFQSSPLADGRRLVNRRFDNVIETFDLSASAITQDGFAEQHQELERLLEKATQYWTTSWQNEPVYLKAKTPCETEPRHALIYNYSLPDLNQILRRPFAGKTPGMTDFSMSIERGHWGADIPGGETCVEISGTGAEGHESSVAEESAINTDDGEYSTTFGLNISAATITMGDAVAAVDFDGIFLFRDVDVPQGSIITAANIRLKAAANDAGAPVFRIIGESSDNAQTLSTAADWLARSLTSNSVAWNPGAWVLNTWYNSSDISTVVQEIVNRPGWAAGNSMLIAVEDNGSPVGIHRECYAIDDPAQIGGELDIVFISADGAGREATCDPEVFIANKHNYRGLTHVWYDDNGVGFSTNRLGHAFPQTLLPAVPAVNDVLYFGIETGPISTITGGGPFWSLVFDLATAAGGTLGNWEFWDTTAGPGWAALAAVQDNTDTGGSPLDTTGVNSVHWQEEVNWGPNAVNGVTGYWVRLVVTGLGAPPVQQIRDIYTILWPYIEIDELQVEGDITALLRAALDNQARYSVNAEFNRVIMGLRSNERGLDFTPYLNCSDQQLIAGITATAFGAGAAFATDAVAPTERILRWTNAAGAVAMARRLRWTFVFPGGDVISPVVQWYGSYHAFVRVYQASGTAENFTLQLTVDIGDQTYNSSGSPATVQSVGFPEIVDLGRLDIPQGTGSLNITEVLDTLYIELHASALANDILDFYDLILIPADEMLIDSQIQTNMWGGGAVGPGEILSIDSTTYPKTPIRSLVFGADHVQSIWRTKGALAFLQSNANQRLWFFLMAWEVFGATEGWVGPFSMSARPQAFANRRYLALRGER